MKKINVWVILVSMVATLILSACAANNNKYNHGKCQANKSNNHKQGRTFIQ